MRAPCRFNPWALALAPVLLQVPSIPPISPDVPNQQEELRARQEIVPPAMVSAETERMDVPQVYEGTLIEVDKQSRAFWVATDDGPQRIKLSKDASIKVDGKPVNDVSELPQGHDVRASLRATDDAEILELKVIDQQNGPNVSPPRDQGSPSISP